MGIINAIAAIGQFRGTTAIRAITGSAIAGGAISGHAGQIDTGAGAAGTIIRSGTFITVTTTRTAGFVSMRTAAGRASIISALVAVIRTNSRSVRFVGLGRVRTAAVAIDSIFTVSRRCLHGSIRSIVS